MIICHSRMVPFRGRLRHVVTERGISDRSIRCFGPFAVAGAVQTKITGKQVRQILRPKTHLGSDQKRYRLSASAGTAVPSGKPSIWASTGEALKSSSYLCSSGCELIEVAVVSVIVLDIFAVITSAYRANTFAGAAFEHHFLKRVSCAPVPIRVCQCATRRAGQCAMHQTVYRLVKVTMATTQSP